MLENIDTDTLRYSNLSYINKLSQSIPAQVTETRTSTILEHQKEWVMSVIRFDVDCHGIPINIPAMQAGSKQITQSIITIEYKGNYYPTNVQFAIPFNPASPYPFNSIFNYQDWLDLVNTAVASSFTDSKIAGTPPLFIYNSVNGLIELYVDQNFIPSAAPNQAFILLNSPMIPYFLNFEFINKFATTLNLNYFQQININNNNTSPIPAVGSRQGYPISVQTAATLYLVKQMAPSTSSWSSLRSIILTSNLLSFRSELVPNQNNNNTYSANNSFPILTDFLVPVDAKVTDSRIVNQYLPTAQYRYIDLTSNSALNTIDIQVHWTDYNGNIYPLYLFSQGVINVKLLFQKRNSLMYKKEIH